MLTSVLLSVIEKNETVFNKAGINNDLYLEKCFIYNTCRQWSLFTIFKSLIDSPPSRRCCFQGDRSSSDESETVLVCLLFYIKK